MCAFKQGYLLSGRSIQSAKRTGRALGHCAQTSKQPLGILAHIQEPCRKVVQEKRLSFDVFDSVMYNRCMW